jgi:hypothetical protein
MNAVLQELLVAVLVGACAVFSAWRLMSARLRLRTLEALGRVPLLSHTHWLQRLRQQTVSGVAGACGGCSQAHPLKPGAVSPNRTPGAPRR